MGKGQSNTTVDVKICLMYHWGDPDVGGRIILRWIFRK
jgi:hypothetical protein